MSSDSNPTGPTGEPVANAEDLKVIPTVREESSPAQKTDALPADETRFQHSAAEDATTFRSATADQTNFATQANLTNFATQADLTNFKTAATTFHTQAERGADIHAASVSSGTVQSGNRLLSGEHIMRGLYVIDHELPSSGREADAYVGHAISEPDKKLFIKHFRNYRTNTQYIAKKAELKPKMLRLDHPNCVPLLATEITDDRIIEIYPLLAGESLLTRLKREPQPDPGFIRAALIQLAAGIGYLHEAVQLAHRDIKPDNVWVVPGDEPTFVLIDYGAVCVTDTGGATVVEYTLKYAPPEALRPALARDEDLRSFDWWSLGRIIQEMADGAHPLARIAPMLQLDAKNMQQVSSVFSAILSEQERDRYSIRAGMVEWSNPAWQPVLRGLLTSKRQLRWGKSAIDDWAAGKPVRDAYDVALDIEVFRYKGREYEYSAAATALAQAENWDDAKGDVMESQGLIAYTKRLMNLPLNADIVEISTAYGTFAAVSRDRAADVVTALTLARLGRDHAMPLTLRGEIITPATIQRAVKDKDVAFIDIFLSPKFRSLLGKFEPSCSQQLLPILTNLSLTMSILADWNVTDLQDPARRADAYELTLTPRTELIHNIERSKKELAHTTHTLMNSVFQKPEKASDESLAAVSFVLRNDPAKSGFVTRAFEELHEAAYIRRELPAAALAYSRAWLLHLTALTDRVNLAPKWAFVLFAALGIAAECTFFDPLITDPNTHYLRAVVYTFGIGVGLIVLRMLLRLSVAHYTRGPAGLPKAGVLSRATAVAVVERLAESAPHRFSLGALYKILTPLNERASHLQPRHPDLRPITPAIPVVPLVLSACIIAVFGLFGSAIFRIRGESAAIEKVPTDYMVLRSLRAFNDRNTHDGDAYTRGAARAYLNDSSRRDHYVRSFQQFGKFESSKLLFSEQWNSRESKYSIFYHRCQFDVHAVRSWDALVALWIDNWQTRPGHKNGCGGRD